MIMKKPLVITFLIAIMVGGLALAGTANFGTVQASTDVIGIISADTTWTKANSPYNLTGPVAVDDGVTLTVEPGVTVNLRGYYIRVNGTLIARGSSSSQIHFNGGAIEFRESSSSWNEQTLSGSIIENAILSSGISIGNASPKINNNTITESIGIGGGSPIISKNTIIAITGSDWLGRPVYDSIGIYLVEKNTAYISDNRISGSFDEAAIKIEGGSPTIERNLISNDYGYGGDDHHQAGILIGRNTSPLIQKNTIAKNAIGIYVYGNSFPTIIYNNIQDNSNYNIYLGSGAQSNINATYNWWGTNEVPKIKQEIYDFEDDFNLGTVTFVPFLTAPNPAAMPDPNAPIPTPTPAIPENTLFILLASLAIVTVATILFKRQERKTVVVKVSSILTALR